MVSRRKLLLGGAAGAALVAGGGVAWWLNTDEGPQQNTPDPTWTAVLPPFGDAVMTRVAGAVVLVVQQKGLAAFDRATGGELWRRDVAGEVVSELGPEVAAWYVRVAGDVCVVPRYDETGLGATAFEVLSLTTGEPRFTVELDGADGVDVEVLTTSVVVRRWENGSDRQRLTAHTLTDGEELWSREFASFLSMPAAFSVRNQLVDVASAGPLLLAPATDLALFDAEDVTVFSLADGKDVATWDYPQDSNGGLTVVGGHLVSNGNEGVLMGYDRKTGETLWTRETLRDLYEGPPRGVYSLVGDLLMDADDRGGHRRIDLRTGEVVEYPDLGGRKLVAVGDGCVALDGGKAELVGFDIAGAESWRVSLGEGPASPDVVLFGEGRVVLSGGLGSDQYLWVVEVATGDVTVVPGGVVSGWEEGVLAAVTLDEPGVLRVFEFA